MKDILKLRKELQEFTNNKNYEKAYILAKQIKTMVNAKDIDFLNYIFIECLAGKITQNTKPQLIKYLDNSKNIVPHLKTILYILNSLNDENFTLNFLDKIGSQVKENDKTIRLLIGQQLLKMNQTKKLAPMLEKLLSHHSKDISVLELILNFLLKLKQWKKAHKYMLQLLAINKNEQVHDHLMLRLAHIEFGLHNFSQALEIFLLSKKKLIKFEPVDNHTFMKTYMHLGDRHNSWKIINSILAKNPKDLFGLRYSGILNLEQNEYDKALKCFLQIKNNGSHLITFAIFAIYFSNKQYKKSYEIYLNWRKSCTDGITIKDITKTTQWTGENLTGKRIFLQCEQGKGDTVQYMRYIEVLKEAEKIYILCRPQEEELIESSVFYNYPNVELLMSDSKKKITYNYQTTMMYLLPILAKAPTDSPIDIPYLKPIKKYKDKWLNYFKSFEGKLKIGFSWRGNPRLPEDWKRSLHKQEIFSIIDTFKGNDKVQFFSCQVADLSVEDEKKLIEYKDDIIDLKGKFSDYRESIAALDCLDLIISPDSSITHIGGALNKKTFLFVSFYREWRWLRSHDTESVWYPSVTIFGQKEYNNYLPVMQEITEEIKKIL